MKRFQIYLRTLLTLGLALLLLITAPFFTRKASAERPTLRIGYVEEPFYSYKDTQGKYQGYTIELLYNISSRGNFALQFVEFPNYEQEDQALLNNEIDLETIVPYSEARNEQYLLSETITLNVPLTLLVRENDDRYQFGDVKAVNEMRVGVTKNDATVDAFKEWCRKNRLHPQLIYYSDYKQELASLQKSEVDAITNGNEISGFPSDNHRSYADL